LKIQSTIFFGESGFGESGLNHRRKPKLATHVTEILNFKSRVKTSTNTPVDDAIRSLLESDIEVSKMAEV